MAYRIIVALDVEAKSMEGAYQRVYETMKTVDDETFQWESTDEWYDDSGDAIDEEEAQRIRMKVFKELNG